MKKYFRKRVEDSLIMRSLLALTLRDRKTIVWVIVIQALFGIFDLIGVGLVGVLGALAVNGVQSKSPGNRVGSLLEIIGLESQNLQTQAMAIGLLAAFFLIFKTIFSVIFLRKTVFFLGRRSAQLSANLISKLLSQPIVKLQGRSMQESLYAVTSGVESVTLGIINTLVVVISDISLLVILAGGLILVDFYLAVTTFATFSLIGFILYKLLQVRAARLGAVHRELAIQSQEKILEVFNSYREIIVRNRRAYYVKSLGNLRFQLANVNAERMFMPNISKYVIELTIVVGLLFVAALQFRLHDASHAISVLSVFMAASTRIAPAILRLQQGALSIKSNSGLAAPTLDLLDSLVGTQQELLDSTFKDVEHIGFRGDIILKNVSITYSGKIIPAVNKVTLEIQPGSVVAFVGSSGAGKSTIVDLILGILDPDDGQVLIQGMKPLDAISRWPGAIAYVPQDVVITNGTVRQNVTLGFSDDEISESQIWKALEIAQLDEYVRTLPDGLETSVGDRGARMSGGQRQRLGIARALCTKPKLLILDEATSALDGATEAEISRAVQELRGSVTIIMIAHRLSTVRNADVVHYLERGKLIASGSFEKVREEIPDFDQQAKLMGL